MLTEFKDNTFYRIMTWKELEKNPKTQKEIDAFGSTLIYGNGECYYTKDMDELPERVFRRGGDLLCVHTCYDDLCAYTIEPWMCEELKEISRFKIGCQYRIKTLGGLFNTDGVKVNNEGDLEQADLSKFRVKYMSKYCGQTFVPKDPLVDIRDGWFIHPWMCELCEFEDTSDKIKVKYHGNAQKLSKIDKGDWIDLRVREVEIVENCKGLTETSTSNMYSKDNLENGGTTYFYDSGEVLKVKLGVSMQLPKGYEGLLVPRSSTFKNYGLMMVNSIGVIDESFSGDEDEWVAMFYATRSGTIQSNDRVCQFRIQKKMKELEFKSVKTLGNESRGGFGTTGTK